MNVISYKNCLLCEGNSIRKHLDVKDHFLSGENFTLFQCSRCEFVFTQAHPGKEDILPYYKSENYISHSNTSRGMVNKIYHFARIYMLGRKRKFIQKLRRKKGGKLLDIGSGTGFFLNHMKQHGWDVSGIEPGEEGRRFSKDTFGLEIKSDMELFQPVGEKFDVITLWHVLEHVHDLDIYMKNIRILLKDKGVLLIALPNMNSTDAGIYGNKWAAYDVPRHLWHFTPSTFSKFAEKYRFQLLKMKSMPLDAVYVSLLSEKYRHNPLGFFTGVLRGLFSMLTGLINVKKSSSVIYILKKS